MSIAGNILERDLDRMAREAPTQWMATWPSMATPRAQADANFHAKHGMTRDQIADRQSTWQRQRFEENSIRDLMGDPPGSCDVKGLGPAQARYGNYFHWRQGVHNKLHELESKKAELESIIAAPLAAETEIVNGIRRTANRLLGRGNESGEGDAKGLADKLAVARHRAEAAALRCQRSSVKSRLRSFGCSISTGANPSF
jgi:hypothetical protein